MSSQLFFFQIMHPIQVRDEMRELLIFHLKFGYNIALMRLISREGEYEVISHLKKLYRELAKKLGINFFRTKKFPHRAHITSDVLHPYLDNFENSPRTSMTL